MSHYGFLDMGKIMAIPDHGAKVHFRDNFIQFVLAHFLHSLCNFSFHDFVSKILFSGDNGVVIVPANDDYKHVTNFEDHKKYMSSNKLYRVWVAHIEHLDIHMLASQHGLLFEGKNIELFLKSLKELQCGSDLI
ncbi:MAG: hypothetical protein PHX13_10150 [Thiovulaceae bacterium]|nr:hypothetical protein [Sulfurimonadaceae bacterium]